MDAKKRASFVAAHTKKRPHFSKGGVIKKIADRKYFDGGGTVNNAVGGNNGFLGGIGDALGLNDQFQAGSAEITPGTNTSQLNSAYTGAQEGLGNQGFVTTSLIPQVPSAVQNQNTVAQSELNMLNGTGPNPALNQLHQTTAQNVAQTTAEQAGQRGAAANVGLIARQAAQQGAATQQQAAGQAATLNSQQQIAAQNNLANLSNNQISQTGQAVTNQNNANQNEQQILQGANTSTNNAAVGMQSNINNANAQTAAANQNQAGDIFGALTSATSAAFGFAHGGEVDHLKLAEMNAHSMNHAKKFADGGVASAPNLGTITPIGSGGGGSGPNIQSTSALPANEEDFSQDVQDLGAAVKKHNSSNSLPTDNSGPIAPGTQMAGGSDAGELGEIMKAAHGGMMMQKICAGPHKSHVANYLASGGPVKAMVSAGEVYLSPERVKKVIHEGANPLKIGEKIKGKAKVKGDSLKNDTIPKTLEEGGVVIPRHITNKMSPEKAELFVHRAIARKKMRG